MNVTLNGWADLCSALDGLLEAYLTFSFVNISDGEHAKVTTVTMWSNNEKSAFIQLHTAVYFNHKYAFNMTTFIHKERTLELSRFVTNLRDDIERRRTEPYGVTAA